MLLSIQLLQKWRGSHFENGWCDVNYVVITGRTISKPLQVSLTDPDPEERLEADTNPDAAAAGADPNA